jgi:hypothetical protein
VTRVRLVTTPVAFVSTSALGVPRAGVTSVWLVEVQAETSPEATTPRAGVISVALVRVGPPVQLSRTPEAGVPKAGVTNVALVRVGPPVQAEISPALGMPIFGVTRVGVSETYVFQTEAATFLATPPFSI